MTGISRGSIGLVALVIVFVVCAPLSGDTPSIETLVARVPILAPSNERLQRFQFTFESPLPFEVPFVARVAWNRPDEYQMVVDAGNERTPFLFLAQKKAMVFDVTSGTALLTENAAPKFFVRPKGHSYNIGYSITSQKDAEVLIDLPAFLRRAVKHGEREIDPAGNWRIATVSESGKAKVSAVFKVTEPFSITELEIRSTADDSLMFAVRDIAINDDVDAPHAVFPTAESFPKDLQIIGLGDRKVEKVRKGGGAVAHGIRTLAAQGALHNPKWRQLPYLGDVDWTLAEERNKTIGSKLSELLTPEMTEPNVRPETSKEPLGDG